MLVPDVVGLCEREESDLPDSKAGTVVGVAFTFVRKVVSRLNAYAGFES